MLDREQQAARLFLNYHRMILNIAFRMAPFPDAPEDIAQDVFIEFVTHADKWNLSADVKPILIKITQNVAMRYWAAKKRDTSPKLLEIAQRFQQRLQKDEIPVGERESILALNLCLDKLSSKSRQLIDLRYNELMDMRKIGDRLGKTPVAVQVSLFRIRKALRNCIESVLRKEVYDE